MSLLIPGTNSIKDTGYDVANSLRFESAYLQNPSSGASSSAERKTLTWSIWLKRSELGATGSTQYLASGRDGSGSYYVGILFNSSDQLRVIQSAGGSTNFDLKTNRVFRDVSAWYHIVVAFDTTQSTNSNRIKIYVNGTQETSFATETYPSQDLATYFGMTSGGDGYPTYIGSNTSAHFSGYMAEVVEIGGSQLTPTSFGEFDSDTPTVWKPKDLSDLSFGSTAGTNVYLDFEDSSDLGNDVSGGNNDYSLNSIAATDQSTDTCTNNFATLNALDNYYASSTITEGALKVVTNSGSYTTNHGTIALASGKWFWEVKVTNSSTEDMIGIRGDQTRSNYDWNESYDFFYNSYGRFYDGSSGSQFVSYGATFTTGDIIGVALDLDSGTNTIQFYKNGSAQGSKNITNVSSTAIGFYNIAVGDYTSGAASTFEINFGSPTFSISSGNADANGYGNFEYSVPSGYYSVNTKNLKEFG